MKRKFLAAVGVLASIAFSFAVPSTATAAIPITAPAKASAEPLPQPDKAKTKTTYGKPIVGSKKGKAAPLNPKGRQTRAVSCAGNPNNVCSFYAGAYQYIVSPDAVTGFGLRTHVGNPVVRTWDTFSLLQTSVESTANGDILEVGWADNPGLCPGGTQTNPRFFVSSWTGGTHNGWGTGFIPAASPAMSYCTDVSSMVGDGVGFRTFWLYDNTGPDDGWHLYYAKAVGATLVDIGYYPASMWPSGFTDANVDLVQGFGELAVDQTPSQTGMGANSLLTANRINASSWQFSGGSAPVANAQKNTSCTTTCDFEKWDLDILSASTFNVGGPGGFEKILSTTTPSADDCSGTGTGTNPSGQGAFCTYDSSATFPVPSGKVTQIDGSAGTACRGNVGTSAGYAGIDMVAMTLPWQVDYYNTGSCTGTPTRLGHGRVLLPVAYRNTANASYKVLGFAVPATCATNGVVVWPNYEPTC